MTGGPRLVVRGEVRVPGDKSISHRALMLAALADGRSRLRGILRAADVESTATVLRTLGLPVPALREAMVVEGHGLSPLPPPSSPLDCGNSGTTARLMMGVVAASPIAARFVGDASLSRRPMRRVARPLEAMGARVEFVGGHEGLPLVVHGGWLHETAWTLEFASAQVKSAMLLAAVCAKVPVTLVEPEPSRDHTERMLRHLGADIRRTGASIHCTPPDRLAPLDLDVPGDPSSAAFFAALGALAEGGEIRVRGVCLNPGRAGFVGVLRRMGASIEVEAATESGPEPVGDLIVRGGGLRGTEIAPAEVPSLIDELPVLACVAARADGETVVRGAAELRIKESDRIAAVVANLRAIGVDADELPDGMRIRGTTRHLAGEVRTHGDHRIAMAFGVLGASGASLAIDDPACVAVSYPGFWQSLADVVG